MESGSNTINLLTRFGVFTIIAPYLGHFDKWRMICLLLCRTTKNSFERNQKGYEGLQELSYSNHHQVIKYIQDLKGYYEDDYFEDNRICLHFITHKHQSEEFLENVSNYRIRELKRLSAYSLSEMSQESIPNLNKFLINSVSHGMSAFTLHGVINLDSLASGLAFVLPRVTGTIKFEFSDISKNTLKVILEN